MFGQSDDFDELGLKVQRAQQALRHIRGVGVVNGIRVIVDAEGRLLSVTIDDEDTVLAAYNAARTDSATQTGHALRELHTDPRFEAVSTFTDANTHHPHTQPAPPPRPVHHDEDDDDYYEQRNRNGWLQ